MNITHSIHRRILPAILVLAAVLCAPAIAHAQQFAWFNGKLLGIFKSTMTIGAASRSGTPPDPRRTA